MDNWTDEELNAVQKMTTVPDSKALEQLARVVLVGLGITIAHELAERAKVNARKK